MLEAQIVRNSLSLVDLAKAIKKEELFDFAKDYLKKHMYISNKKLGTEYLGVYYNLTSSRMDYDKIKRVLVNKFRNTIRLLVREGLIAGYNNIGLYKRVDEQKTDSCSIIDKSLSSDIVKTDPNTNSKISSQILQKTVIDSTTTGLETKTNEVKLVYYQGRFVNPKFYNLEHQYLEYLSKL